MHKQRYSCQAAFWITVLLAGLSLMPAGPVTAQTFTTLHSFTNGSDGAHPSAELVLSGGTLYGTAATGGTSSNGTVFAINTDGTGFATLHNFTGGGDGGLPVAAMILSGNTLYGTAYQGGSSTNGTVFKINTDGTGFTTLHSFTATPYNGVGFGYTNSDGANPQAKLLLSGNTLYGTTKHGGTSGAGTVFKVNADGTGFSTLHSLSYASDGAYPQAGLVLSGSTLYGTAFQGGPLGHGTIFKVNTDGLGFATLHSFSYDSDGADPVAGLVLSGNTLYGTAWYGGGSENGTVFKINTDGNYFTPLYSFPFAFYTPVPTNSDGVFPEAGLILSGNTLFGTASSGGSAGNGTVFALNTDGTGFMNLHTFTATAGSSPFTNSDGATPFAGLVLSGNTLYGTAYQGGSTGHGTVFRLSLPLPQLTIIRSGAAVIVSWPTNGVGVGFTLQSTTNLVSPASWSAVSTETAFVNGRSTVTNPASAAQRFFRLKSQ